MRPKLFCPTTQKIADKPLFGFDIETYDNNRGFLCGSVWNESFSKTFFDKKSMIDFFKTRPFRNSVVVATNLSFDFFGLFHGSEEVKYFKTLFRGSDLIHAVTYLHDGFSRDSSKGRSLKFIDTFNFARFPVHKMGEILKLPKLKKPGFLGKRPRNKKQWQELVEYNVRDAEISARFMKFLLNGFYSMGSSFRPTIASTAMSTFRNRYLKTSFFRHNVSDLKKQIKAYYGGRCETFSRGLIRNYKLYDFNSLYPSVMVNEFPNPKTLVRAKRDSTGFIDCYEGISNVRIKSSDDYFPLLPLRGEKLLFPNGTFKGWYSHVELRKAVDLGYSVEKVFETHYFKETFFPFRDYVEELYRMRLKYQREKNPLEVVTKLLLNSLYGKFAQKFIDRDNVIPMPTYEELMKLEWFEPVGKAYIRIKKTFTNPPVFTIPIWSLYVTAYARLKLFSILGKGAIYCDTDSIITKRSLDESSRLGALKLEHRIKEGMLVRPKFYAFRTEEVDKVKIKGLGTRITYPFFFEFINNPVHSYKKFARFRESLRRGFLPNEIIPVTKSFSLEDDKRLWKSRFTGSFENSQPLSVGFQA